MSFKKVKDLTKEEGCFRNLKNRFCLHLLSFDVEKAPSFALLIPTQRDRYKTRSSSLFLLSFFLLPLSFKSYEAFSREKHIRFYNYKVPLWNYAFYSFTFCLSYNLCDSSLFLFQN